MEDVQEPGAVVKFVQVRRMSSATHAREAWNGHSVSIDIPPADCSVVFYSITQPCSLLQRPQAIEPRFLLKELRSSTAQKAIPVAVAAYHKLSDPESPLTSLPSDPLKIADHTSLVEFGHGEVGLLMTTSADTTPLVLPPEGASGEVVEEGDFEAQTLEGSSETQPDQSTAILAARMALTQILLSDGMKNFSSGAAKDKEVFMIWAESPEGISVSPSLLLATALLTARKEAAMFLRMATGFGYAQVGDYTASLFYLFKRKGHRLKCWECGVKKKAPCGKTDRNDLPWCCHRRLGEWLPRIVAFMQHDTCSIGFVDNGKCFLGLLPPRNAMEADNPLAAQVNYQPRPSDVVPLSDVLQERPSHPRHTLRKALHRLAPTCRLLWCKTPWIVNTIEKIKAGKDISAISAHLWLEKTAFYKVPRSLQDETVEVNGRTFEDLVEELLPDVEDAPILGGHNRNPRPTNALADRPQQHAPAFTPESSMEFESPEDGSVPSFGVLGHQLPQPSSREKFQRPAPKHVLGGLPRHPSLLRVSHSENPTDGSNSLLGYPNGTLPHGSGEWSDSATDFSAQEDRAWANTGQGRRRLNARAALRAAGHKDSCVLGDSLQGGQKKSGGHTIDPHLKSRLSAETAFSTEDLPGLQQRAGNMAAKENIPSYQCLSDLKNPMRRSEGPTSYPSEVSQAQKMPLPLQIVVNAHSVDFHSNWKNMNRGSKALPHHPLVDIEEKGHDSCFQRYQPSTASCHVSVRPESRRLASRAADPDYVPLRANHSSDGLHYPGLSRHASAEKLDSRQMSTFRTQARKPRTARLQFWSQAVGAGGKRSSSISEDKELFSMQSSLFAPARRPAAASKQAIKRKRQPLTVSTEDEEDEYVKWNPRRSSSPSQSPTSVRDFGAMNPLLHAVQLLSNCD